MLSLSHNVMERDNIRKHKNESGITRDFVRAVDSSADSMVDSDLYPIYAVIL